MIMNRAFTLALSALITVATFAQDNGKRSYFSGGSEIAFSNPILDVNGNSNGAVVRFAPVLNVQQTMNKDMSDKFGLFFGLGVCNNGFIYAVPDTDYRYKFRTYNLAVPVGFKIGTMNKGLFFAGYSFEWAFNYKEKEFLNEKKDKFVVWASDRVEPIQQAVMAGFQMGNGTTLKVKYYFTNFHKQDYSENQMVDGVSTRVKPYDGLNANVLSVSLGFALFQDEAEAYKY